MQIPIQMTFDEKKIIRIVETIINRRISKIINKIFKEGDYAKKIKQKVEQLCVDELNGGIKCQKK